MAIAAVPIYLGNDFSKASPGLRFGMYLKLWGVNRRSSELLWTTHDIGHEVRGQNGQEREVKNENKVSALKETTGLTENDKATMQSLFKRQQKAFAAYTHAEEGIVFDAQSVAPFTTGLGNEHPLENGFSFLNPYGLPYLPGSGVKGVLRQAARELAKGEWGETHGWDEKKYPKVINGIDDWGYLVIDALFGKEDSNEAQRGALTFWDVIPQIAPTDSKKPDEISLLVEIMTPHQTHYYQDGQSPHDSGQPVPISFLTVPPGSGFTFHIQCNLTLLERNAPSLTKENKWKELLQAAFEHAFNWLGFGAKTAVGYGAMQEDAIKKAARKEQLRQQQEAARRSTLSSEDLAYEEHQPVIDDFLKAFDHARKGPYQAGQEFDSKRNIFIDAAKSWEDLRSRHEAAALLEDTIKWGASKKGKDRLKEAVTQLREHPAS